MEYIDDFMDDFMEDGHYIDYEDKVAARLFWENVIFEDEQDNDEINTVKGK